MNKPLNLNKALINCMLSGANLSSDGGGEAFNKM